MTAELLHRHGAAGDLAGVDAVDVEAFGGDAEARPVDAPRTGGRAVLSPVAVDGDRIVGRLPLSRCHPASSLGG
ncbi:MAG: hypothetical protein ACM3O7_07285 [Acidobacteriota bacterium]